MFKPRWYQLAAENSIFEYFQSGKTGNPVLVLPTGTGKSVIVASFIKRVLQTWPNQRVMMLTHVKELIAQNASKLQAVWPTAPIGVHSAGLKSRDTLNPIIFGGVQSVSKTIEKAEKDGFEFAGCTNPFGHRDLVIIDEAHLFSPKEGTQYQYIIGELKKVNPNIKVIGLTATPYRLGQGMLTDDGFFTDICYDISGVEAFNRLISEGFLAPLIPRATTTQVDVSNVGMSAGDFNRKQLQNAVDKDEITYNALKEACELGYDRKCWMIFASGVDHCEHIAAMLETFGISATFVHSKIKAKERDRRLEDFKAGVYQAIVGFRVLTTGFDHPPIDLIIDLYPTVSPGMHVQKYGRGTRPCEGKENCLVLDFAGNTKRLGPINDPVLPRKKGKGGGGGDAPVRICDTCGVYNHASARFCISCNTEFSFQSKLTASAGTNELIKSHVPQVEYLDVQKVIYNLHQKKNRQGVHTSPPSIKVSYFCGLQMFNEWVCLEHSGFAGKKARDWWRQRHEEEPPPTTYEALQKTSQLRTPAKIRVHLNKKHPEILGVEW